MTRTIHLSGLDQDLPLSRVTAVKVPKKFIMLEEMQDGTYRLTYSTSLIPEIQDLNGLILVRSD